MNLETKRQFIHLVGLAFVLVAQYMEKYHAVIMFFGIGAIFFLYSEYVRRVKTKIGLRNFMMGFERKVKRSFTGAIWFYVSCGISFLVFPLEAAAPACAILAVGDSVATLIGYNFGKHKIIGKKTWEGSIAFLISSFLISLIWLRWEIGLVAALIATLIELGVSVKKLEKIRNTGWLDDNLIIPTITGLFILLINSYILIM